MRIRLDQAKEIFDAVKVPRLLLDLKFGKPVLLMACEEGHIQVVGWLLSYKPDLEATNTNGETALIVIA